MPPFFEGFIAGMLFQRADPHRPIDYSGRVYAREFRNGHLLAVLVRLPIYGCLILLALNAMSR